jgi:class 3 adenylate cyclase
VPTSAQLVPVASRIARARHDMRNPIGEIIGFAEILRAESGASCDAALQPAFATLCADANAILVQINHTLDLDTLREYPASVDVLRDAVAAYCSKASTSALDLRARCAALPDQPYLEDLDRIAAAAEELARQSPALLAELYEAKSSEAPGTTDGQANTPGANPIFCHTLGAASSPDESNTSILRRATAPVAAASILVVDDNEANRALLTRRLTRNGHTVSHAEDGRRALDRLRENAFDLVLLDVLMPHMDGHEVLQAMKADPAQRHIPVIMITGLDDLDSLIRCIEGGAEDYLTKPFDPILLNARIGACLEKKRLRDTEQNLLRQVRDAQAKSEELLLNILPRSIAERLKAGESTIVDTLPAVTVLFSDLVGFTELSARISGTEMVRLLDELFTTFDLLAQQQGLEKIKTIGDAYMVVGGLPVPRPDHAHAIAELALNMLAAVGEKFAGTHFPIPVRVRIGINSGPVVAGVIGRNKFSYDLWGDTVNTASRMESHGVTGAIQVSDATRRLLGDDYTFTRRDLSQVKGKGDLTAWLLTGRAKR